MTGHRFNTEQQNTKHKTRNTKQLLTALLIAGIVGGGCYKKPDEAVENDDGPLWAAPTFNLVDQDGQPFSSDKLKGKTWIVTLFFTTCPGPCPMMSNRMRKIQKSVDDPNVMLVSLSVDPNHDTPEKLKDYSRNMTADPARWVFLTGKPEDVQKTADGFKLGFEPAKGDEPIMHDTKFLLVDKTGQVRGIYRTSEDASMAQLEKDAKKLAQM
ncbi:MAG: SCO family protein [Tepidisphaeraceae bacterium]